VHYIANERKVAPPIAKWHHNEYLQTLPQRVKS
jgi:hypothetical protein